MQQIHTLDISIIIELGDKALDEEIDERIKRGKKFTEKEIISIFKQMVSVLSCLQKMNIAHRDIKPQNIVKHGENYKIIDLDAGKSFETEVAVQN
jgi:serine/threonine protein kinase